MQTQNVFGGKSDAGTLYGLSKIRKNESNKNHVSQSHVETTVTLFTAIAHSLTQSYSDDFLKLVCHPATFFCVPLFN
jgi:hypothetical protein